MVVGQVDVGQESLLPNWQIQKNLPDWAGPAAG